jgi:phage terminase large subunit-like protein
MMPTIADRWRADPVAFIEQVLFDPETGRPFKLLPAQRLFLAYAFLTGDDGRLLYPEQVLAAPKKSGKTGFAALYLLTIILLFGSKFAEGYALANDLEQAQSRVYQAIRRIVEASPLLSKIARITNDKIVFPELNDATISALANDYAGAAGANPTCSVFDELWGFVSQRSRRLWDEMVPPPTRKIACRLTVTYAGFEGESTLLEELYHRGLKQSIVGPCLHAGDGILMFWSHEPIAPWQTEKWIEEMRRSLPPNQFLRMIRNEFVTSESTFVDMNAWDRCVDPNIGHALPDRGLSAFVGVDASVKHDSTAIVVVTFDQKSKLVRLIFHRIFQPSPDDQLDFEKTIEQTILDLSKRFRLHKVLFDPFQMAASAQRLAKAGIPITEFPQSGPNLTAASQNLFELIQSGAIVAYPDAQMRLAISHAIAKETSRGWRIAKEKQSHKIDVVVALAMAAHAAIQGQNDPAPFNQNYAEWISGDGGAEDWSRFQRSLYMFRESGGRFWG